mmetsp:Transcript_6749/g.11493  ORF Transcript_6749/g.11493 Transcript_6749/m.11493 type:complete len:123 (-) Transcript_6749:812-1180(-)
MSITLITMTTIVGHHMMTWTQWTNIGFMMILSQILIISMATTHPKLILMISTGSSSITIMTGSSLIMTITGGMSSTISSGRITMTTGVMRTTRKRNRTRSDMNIVNGEGTLKTYLMLMRGCI